MAERSGMEWSFTLQVGSYGNRAARELPRKQTKTPEEACAFLWAELKTPADRQPPALSRLMDRKE